ncbi:MAG: type II toxin-antitoxin system VapC family toxin [Caldilineaceae bacterium]
MKLLLDTHTFLWFVNDDTRLSSSAAALLESENDVLVSLVSLWEIAIKYSLGKLALPAPYEEFVAQQILANEIDVLPIQIAHLTAVSQLPFHHNDPFDRLLIAQSIVEGVPIISIDSIFDRYSVRRLW